MGSYVTGETIRALREKKGYTQRQLAELIMVSDKAVSKWETGRGLPDITLLEPLGAALGVSIAELLSGQPVENPQPSGEYASQRFFRMPYLRQYFILLRLRGIQLLRGQSASPGRGKGGGRAYDPYHPRRG